MTNLRPRLGVNVDHIATLRQARSTIFPDPVTAAAFSELAGADQITVHLREDRRHIQERDIRILRETVNTRLNLEMAATPEMLKLALEIKPDMVTLVPEKPDERTTEGGLAVHEHADQLRDYIEKLRPCGAYISLFVDPIERQIEASAKLGVEIIELHTGDYCEAAGAFSNHTRQTRFNYEEELEKIKKSAQLAHSLGLIVAAGHGLDYKNVLPIAAIPEIEEFNIGHSIISRAVLVGLERAVREMIDALLLGRAQG